MLGNDSSIDPEDVRDKLKIELIVLNGALKDLNKNWDFSDVIRPLLTDQGPALPTVPKLTTLIVRLKKIRDDFLAKKAEDEAEEKAKQEPEEKARRELSREAEEKAKNEIQPGEGDEGGGGQKAGMDKKQGCRILRFSWNSFLAAQCSN
jgi:hypothetical protein